jgi:hypothetical protein
MIYCRKYSHNERSAMQDEEFLEDYLRQVREYQPGLPPPFLLEMVAYEEQVFLNTRQRGDHHATFRLSVLYALHKACSLDDRAFIRFLLEQEIIYTYRIWAFPHSIHLCGFFLSRRPFNWRRECGNVRQEKVLSICTKPTSLPPSSRSLKQQAS